METWGSVGVENAITEEEIREADGIILAVDKDVEKRRFHGKPVLECSVQEAIHHPEALIKRLEKGDVPLYRNPEQAEEKPAEDASAEKAKSGHSFYRNLMNGVSYMIPFVVVGGLLIALALGFGGKATPEGFVVPDDSLWKPILAVGETGFLFMVPILAGFIAYSIADRPGLAPGMIGGYIAADGSFYGSEAGAGFIGGILAGFLAGYLAKGIRSIKVPEIIQPIMPILVIPLITSLLTALLFIFVLGAPISGMMEGLTQWLHDMQGAGQVALAMILGAMIAFDMGGPVNKVAFLFGAAMIVEGQPFIMGAIASAICIPPLGMGLATLLSKRKYYPEEREAGKAALAMGLVGITEGAIPFASAIPSASSRAS